MKRLLTLMTLSLPALLAACSSNTIQGVKTFTNTSSHVAGKVTYPQNPPAGGAHNPAWQNCGVYERPLYNEYAVHSMEHGAVWIMYREETAVDQVQQLQQAVAGRDYVLLSPYADLKAPVTVSAWNAQLELDSPTDPRLLKFIQKYAQGGTAPEIGASCSGAYGETT